MKNKVYLIVFTTFFLFKKAYISSKNKNSTNSRLIKLSKNDKIFTEKSEKEVIKNG